VVPHAYALPPEWTAVKELLEAHGVRTEALASDAAAEVETCRFSAVKWSEQPYEGRHPLTFQTTWKRGREVLRAGTVIVPMAQRGARVALNILEPDAPDGAVRWGFFDTVFEPKEYYSAYIMEPIARRMLESDPGLRREFEARLRRDPAFAASPRERLNFFYERSPYADRNRDLYPVLRVIRLEKR
jgi:hypothetical protein